MVFSRAEHVAWRKVGGETVVINLKSKRLYVLNASGGFFWHALDGVRELGDIVALVPSETDLPSREVVLRFFRELEEYGLVELVEEETHHRAPRMHAKESSCPGSVFVSPEIVWQEEIRNFGISCAFISCAFIGGQSEACEQAPTM